VDSVLNDFFKVFEGKTVFNIDGDRDIQTLNQWVLKEKPAKWIEKFAKQVFKNKPNSFAVVDKDQDGKPYLVFVDSNRLIDAQFKDDEGNLEYIAFIHSQKQHETQTDVITTFFYDTNYFVFSKDSSGSIDQGWSNGTRDRYCPEIIHQDNIQSKNKFKAIAFSSAL
jgi:hypothetical protein